MHHRTQFNIFNYKISRSNFEASSSKISFYIKFTILAAASDAYLNLLGGETFVRKQELNYSAWGHRNVHQTL